MTKKVVQRFGCTLMVVCAVACDSVGAENKSSALGETEREIIDAGLYDDSSSCWWLDGGSCEELTIDSDAPRCDRGDASACDRGEVCDMLACEFAQGECAGGCRACSTQDWISGYSVPGDVECAEITSISVMQDCSTEGGYHVNIAVTEHDGGAVYQVTGLLRDVDITDSHIAPGFYEMDAVSETGETSNVGLRIREFDARFSRGADITLEFLTGLETFLRGSVCDWSVADNCRPTEIP